MEIGKTNETEYERKSFANEKNPHLRTESMRNFVLHNIFLFLCHIEPRRKMTTSNSHNDVLFYFCLPFTVTGRVRNLICDFDIIFSSDFGRASMWSKHLRSVFVGALKYAKTRQTNLLSTPSESIS